MKNVIVTLFVSLIPHIALMVGLVFQVYVWHTRTESPKLNMEEKLRAKGVHSDAGMEVWSGNVWDIRICAITTQIDVGWLFWLVPVRRTCVREIGHRLEWDEERAYSFHIRPTSAVQPVSSAHAQARQLACSLFCVY